MTRNRGEAMQVYYEDNRYRLKAAYQRNMTVGMLVAAVVLVAPSLFLALIESPPHPTLRLLPFPADIGVPPRSKTISMVRPRYDGPGFHGQFGVDVVVVPDSPEPDIITKPPAANLRVPAVPELSDAIAVATEDGENLGFGGEAIPSDVDFFIDTTPSPLDRDSIIVVEKTDPNYPPIAIRTQKEGRVSVLLYVNELGELDRFPDDIKRDARIKTLDYVLDGRRHKLEYYIVSEEPKDWFFARNLLKVLPSWRFLPEVDRGTPVGDYLIITYNYCIGLNCARLDLQSRRKR
jgi:hypothetical protein